MQATEFASSTSEHEYDIPGPKCIGCGERVAKVDHDYGTCERCTSKVISNELHLMEQWLRSQGMRGRAEVLVVAQEILDGRR